MDILIWLPRSHLPWQSSRAASPQTLWWSPCLQAAAGPAPRAGCWRGPPDQREESIKSIDQWDESTEMGVLTNKSWVLPGLAWIAGGRWQGPAASSPPPPPDQRWGSGWGATRLRPWTADTNEHRISKLPLIQLWSFYVRKLVVLEVV